MFTSYQETLDYLYKNLPMFQRVGAPALKKDLFNTITLCRELGNPQHRFKSIHVAGTNGKGSTAHMIASVLQSAGYKTGLYTSPHLKEFTERIRVNGREVDKEYIVEFVSRMQASMEKLKPSFFEITVAMAFDYFVQQQVDVAVIEVGLGGRLDSTNVITPMVSVITNIGYDHMDLLGETLPEIAAEKAGIIKPGIPVVISERQKEVEGVFIETASKNDSQLFFASDEFVCKKDGSGFLEIKSASGLSLSGIKLDLLGAYQIKNLPGVLKAIELLGLKGFVIQEDHLRHGLANVIRQTGLKGRWQVLGQNPMIVCDTGHNKEGLRDTIQQLKSCTYKKLFMIFGLVKEKDRNDLWKILPTDAYYIFCQASIPRALDAHLLAEEAKAHGLNGIVIPSVADAIDKAKQIASPEDLIFIGGSTFVVAEIPAL